MTCFLGRLYTNLVLSCMYIIWSLSPFLLHFNVAFLIYIPLRGCNYKRDLIRILPKMQKGNFYCRQRQTLHVKLLLQNTIIKCIDTFTFLSSIALFNKTIVFISFCAIINRSKLLPKPILRNTKSYAAHSNIFKRHQTTFLQRGLSLKLLAINNVIYYLTVPRLWYC